MNTLTRNESTEERKCYEAPTVEVIEMESEGVIASSQLENPYQNDPIEW